jgi:hypothetical protein
LIAPAVGVAGDGPVVNLDSKGKAKTKFVFLKAKVGSDGVVTPGQPETISIARMAPKARIAVFLEAPPTTIQCGELYFCDPAPAAPAPGSDPFNPKIRTPVAFADQQRIHIDVEGASKIKNVKRESFGFARAMVQR